MNLLPFLRSRRRARYTFQKDNAPMHVSRETRTWFDAKKVNSTNELKLAIIKEWEELSLSYLQNLVNKMSNKIYVQGGYTHY